ncbi:hypothetical protein THMIRHAM_02240 [Thiomicrorhabdus immobilis]|uniref:MOSC domain-containing protein n=1 Tax=Thiomicrorhabdus immobilis TaxID=2791037 RepID=A0ABM7MAS3_9GAMM|nr:MOSC domain-containing protein [Thiomicrorhabdus immobilis]BCN92439.1 hypothetical protein THMIRHAM_02240 [Thiomicrorhabdus immobilis]
MKIVSVNIGKIVEKPWRDGTSTAIHKQAVQERIKLSKFGLEGDEQADLKSHGGEDKAVLVLPSSAYMRFEIAHPYGFLGENLTINDIDEAEIRLGDRLQIGSVLLEVTQPRSPCWKLDALVTEDSQKWQAGEFLKAYGESGHVGFYCRVLSEGWLETNHSVRWLTRSAESAEKFPAVSIKDLFLAKLNPSSEKDWKTLKRALKHPALSKAWQASIQQLLDSRESKKSKQ